MIGDPVLAALVAGLVTVVVTLVLWRASSSMFAAPALRRTNYRGHDLPVAAGIVVVLGVLAVAAVGHLVAAAVGVTDREDALALASLDRALLAGLGFGLLGLVDDLIGDTDRRGFRGHIGALGQGRLTTGFVKLAGGVAVGVVVAGRPGADLMDVLRGGLVVAATANLGNLFDRAPGRVIKVSVMGLAVAFALGVPTAAALGPLVVVAAGVGLIGADLRERCMLGDTGSNVLGAAVGLALVTATGPTGQWIVLAVVVAANLASERISFSRVIDAVAPLRWVDRWGSLRR